MSVPACLRLADEVFPRVRAIAVHRLVADGWSQIRAGAAVGLSQAMVSRHLAVRPPTDPLAERLADDLCDSLTAAPQPAVGPSAWCTTLSVGRDRIGGDAALADLLAAERALRAAPPLHLMPQVGLNVARALPGAAAAEDVLAFPGRLVEAGGRLLSPAPPAFGGSGHLARCLLAVRERKPEAFALANVRGGRDVQAAAKRLGWSVAAVQRGPRADADGPVLAAVRKAPASHAWHDGGAVGLEPCLYIAGRDAVEVAQRIAALDQAVRA